MDQIIRGRVCDFEGEPYQCTECTDSFTEEEWNERHSNAEGDDVHSYCCPICLEKNVKLNVDWAFLKEQVDMLGNFQARNFSKMKNPEHPLCGGFAQVDLNEAEDDAFEGILSLLEAMLDEHIEDCKHRPNLEECNE